MRTHQGEHSGKHYGRQHARTAQLYRQRREARERAEHGQQGMTDEVLAEPLGAEAPPMEEPILHTQRDVEPENVEPHTESLPDEATRERLRTRAQRAVASVVQAARKAHPLKSAKKLAGTAVSGVRRVAREVSARKGHTAPKE